jgi:hypothetical protein
MFYAHNDNRQYTRVVLQYGWIPFIIYMGTVTEPKVQSVQDLVFGAPIEEPPQRPQ